MSAFNPCFVVPTFNHSTTLPSTLNQIMKYDLHCIVVDDGSSPIHKERIHSACGRHNQIELITFGQNRGKGAAVIEAIKHAHRKGFTHAFQIDSDGQHDLTQITRFLRVAEASPEATILGNPNYDVNAPLARRLLRYLTHTWVWINTLSLHIRDSMCGFRIYPIASTMRVIDNSSLGHRMEFDSEILVRLAWQGMQFINKTVDVYYPEEGSSNFNLVRDNLLLSKMHAKCFFLMLAKSPQILKNKKKERLAWYQIQDRGMVLGMRILAWVDHNIGRWLFTIALSPIIFYYLLTNSLARTAAEEYQEKLSKKFPELDLKPGFSSTQKQFTNFAHSILDRLSLWMGESKNDETLFSGQENVLQHITKGQGVLLVGSHIGCIEITRALANGNPDLKLNVLQHSKNAKKTHKLLAPYIRSENVDLIEVTEFSAATAMKLIEKVANGEMVIIAADRIPATDTSAVVSADFLGAPVLMPTGPWILAHILKCPVLTLICIKEESSYHIYFDEFADRISLPRSDRENQLALVIQQYTNHLERYCQQAPLQWYNFYNYWLDQNPANTLSNQAE